MRHIRVVPMFAFLYLLSAYSDSAQVPGNTRGAGIVVGSIALLQERPSPRLLTLVKAANKGLLDSVVSTRLPPKRAIAATTRKNPSTPAAVTVRPLKAAKKELLHSIASKPLPPRRAAAAEKSRPKAAPSDAEPRQSAPSNAHNIAAIEPEESHLASLVASHFERALWSESMLAHSENLQPTSTEAAAEKAEFTSAKAAPEKPTAVKPTVANPAAVKTASVKAEKPQPSATVRERSSQKPGSKSSAQAKKPEPKAATQAKRSEKVDDAPRARPDGSLMAYAPISTPAHSRRNSNSAEPRKADSASDDSQLRIGYLPSSLPKEATGRGSDEQDVWEAVFRHQFAHDSGDVDYYFLFIADRGGDPPSSFIRRFADQAHPVEPASSAAPSDELGVTHKKHSGRGVIYKIKNIQWLDRDTAEVTGGRYAGQTNASDSRYRVERQGGSWNVVKDKRLWVSLGGQ